MKIDPVCGMEVVENTPNVPTAEHGDERYYFCSTECKAEFETDPEEYVGDEEDD